MTRRPTDEVPFGFEGPLYTMNMVCAHPSCVERAPERHHVWRRSLLGGPFSWVALPDGSAIGNLVGFCHNHHAALSDDRAQLSFEDGLLWWVSDSAEVMPLSFQPPLVAQFDYQDPMETQFENAGEKMRPIRPNECVTCGQPLPHPKHSTNGSKREQKRIRRTWSLTVPVDHRENGAEILDTLLEEARVELDKAGLSFGGERSTRYFVMATVLGLFVSHFDELVPVEGNE